MQRMRQLATAHRPSACAISHAVASCATDLHEYNPRDRHLCPGAAPTLTPGSRPSLRVSGTPVGFGRGSSATLRPEVVRQTTLVQHLCLRSEEKLSSPASCGGKT